MGLYLVQLLLSWASVRAATPECLVTRVGALRQIRGCGEPAKLFVSPDMESSLCTGAVLGNRAAGQIQLPYRRALTPHTGGLSRTKGVQSLPAEAT